MTLLANPSHRATLSWIVLLVATAVTYWLGESGTAGQAGSSAVFAMFGLALVKGRLVVYDFMDLRHAPTLWKVLLLGWLTFVIGMILLAYWMGIE